MITRTDNSENLIGLNINNRMMQHYSTIGLSEIAFVVVWTGNIKYN